jgi:protein-tyrosine phosphatase
MIDIHSHILYGLDDGAKTREQSLAMLTMAAETGTTDIVATPHADLQFPFNPELVAERLADLRLATEGVIRIHAGCDFHLQYDNIQDALKNPTKYTINGCGYLMVEFSDLVIFNNTEDIFERMHSVGITPVVTHPERNPLLQQRLDRLERWTSNGILLQVTAQSLLGRFGNAAKRCSEELMDRNLVHFIASDAHDTEHRPPCLDEAFEYVSRKYGAARASRLLERNPAAVLIGEALPVDVEPEAPVKRPWYRFWR